MLIMEVNETTGLKTQKRCKWPSQNSNQGILPENMQNLTPEVSGEARGSAGSWTTPPGAGLALVEYSELTVGSDQLSQ